VAQEKVVADVREAFLAVLPSEPSHLVHQSGQGLEIDGRARVVVGDVHEKDRVAVVIEAGSARHGRPAIFDAHRDSRFNDPRCRSAANRHLPTGAGVQVSMVGERRWMDDVLMERLWWSLTDAGGYLHAGETGAEACADIGEWTTCHDGERPPFGFGRRTPLEAHRGDGGGRLAA